MYAIWIVYTSEFSAFPGLQLIERRDFASYELAVYKLYRGKLWIRFSFRSLVLLSLCVSCSVADKTESTTEEVPHEYRLQAKFSFKNISFCLHPNDLFPRITIRELYIQLFKSGAGVCTYAHSNEKYTIVNGLQQLWRDLSFNETAVSWWMYIMKLLRRVSLITQADFIFLRIFKF